MAFSPRRLAAVQRPSPQASLPVPLIAHDEDGRVGIGNLGQLVVKLEHWRALTEQFRQTARLAGATSRKRMDLLLKLPGVRPARRRIISSSFHFDRLGDKVVGPPRGIAAIADSRLPKAVITITGMVRGRAANQPAGRNSSPSMPGIRRIGKHDNRNPRGAKDFVGFSRGGKRPRGLEVPQLEIGFPSKLRGIAPAHRRQSLSAAS